MPRFAANLTFHWADLPVYDRFRAAADAGFSRVEILFVHDLDTDRVQRLLRDLHLELVLFDPRPGDWARGDRGLLAVPGREEEFLASIREALEHAKRLGTPRVNALAGLNGNRETAIANLRKAAPLAERAGVQILVEAINGVDWPGSFASTPDIAASLVQAAESPAVRLQLDQYHASMIGEDPRETLKRHFPLVAHVQIGDVPGRHEPGTGTQPIAQFLRDLDDRGYAGFVGLEYRPLAGLGWLPRDQRGY